MTENTKNLVMEKILNSKTEVLETLNNLDGYVKNGSLYKYKLLNDGLHTKTEFFTNIINGKFNDLEKEIDEIIKVDVNNYELQVCSDENSSFKLSFNKDELEEQKLKVENILMNYLKDMLESDKSENPTIVKNYNILKKYRNVLQNLIELQKEVL
jgi:hypothetical protein